MVKDRKYSKPVSKYIINKKDKYIFGSGNEESSMLEGNNHLNFWVHVFVLGGFLYCSMSCRELDLFFLNWWTVEFGRKDCFKIKAGFPTLRRQAQSRYKNI